MVTKNSSPIRTAREAQNLSQVRLAVLAKKSLSTIRNAEAGLATTETLRAIARVLGVDVHALRAPVSCEPSRAQGAA